MRAAYIRYHSALADYFSTQLLFFDGDLQKKPHIRKCVELPFQQTKAGLWDEVTDTLCNLNFIQAKAVAKMTYDLVRDFNDVLELIPDNMGNIREEKARQERMEKYTRDLIGCAKGEIKIDELEIPESVTPWSQEKIDAEIERIITNPIRLDRLKDFINFLGKEVGNLQNYALEFPHFTSQLAWNHTDSGPVSTAGEEGSPEIYKNLFLRHYRPLFNPLPQVLKILHQCATVISITPDGRRAFIGSMETCFLWNLDTGEVIKILRGHTGYVTAVSITPDGRRAVSGSFDMTCILWDLDKGIALKTLRGHTDWINAISITPDGRLAVTGSKVKIGYNVKTCILWDLDSGEPLKILKEYDDVSSVFITPDGRRVVSCYAGTIYLWDLDTGTCFKSFKYFIKGVTNFSITPDGRRIVSFYNETCFLWDLDTGNALKTLRGHTDQVRAISITPDGRRAVSGSEDTTCILWDLDTGEALKILRGHTGSVSAVSITPDGRRAVSGSNECILWDLENGNVHKNLKGSNKWIRALSTTADGRWVVSGSSDTNCIVWDLKTGEALKTLRGHTDQVKVIAITPDGKRAVSGSYETCILWDLNMGIALKTLSGHTDWINAISITPDGRLAVTGSNDTTCILWDLDTGEALKILDGHDSVSALSITPDGRRALSGYEGTCIMWDLDTGKALQTLKVNSSLMDVALIRVISISPNGKCAVLSSINSKCITWDLDTGEVLKTLTGHSDYIYAVSITPDGKRAVSGSGDNTCILWDLDTGDALKILKGHTGSVRAVSITPDGRRAVSCSEESCILWDLINGEQVARFVSNSIINIAVFFNSNVFGVESQDNMFVLTLSKVSSCTLKSLVTVRQIWDFGLRHYFPLSADCPLCGKRFAPSPSVLATIENITNNAGLRPDQSPCLDLPDEAWEESGLLGNCPKCGGELKFNPFIAG